MVDSGSMVKRLGAKNPEAMDKQMVYSVIPICFIFAEIAAILHDTKNCNFAVIAAMSATFAVQNSLLYIAITATCVMGFPEDGA